jgi:Ca2+-binding RTX toxin-like protein
MAGSRTKKPVPALAPLSPEPPWHADAAMSRLDGLPTADLFSSRVARGDLATVRPTAEYPPIPIIGTENSETMTGTPDHDIMDARGGDDIVYGLDGYDEIDGGTGNDVIYGDDGHDTIDGGTGADFMDGGIGRDNFYVDDVGDVVIEAFEAGQTPSAGDDIYTSVSYALTEDQHIEQLNGIPTDTDPINLTGNSRLQQILGNSGDNVLNGGGGADILGGRGGDDTFYIVSGNEIIFEYPSLGRDVVYSPVSYILAADASIEVLSTTALGGTDPINFAGNKLAQAIYGNAGANIIIGRGGADYMVGFGGDDTYYLSNGNEYVAENAGEGRDVIYTSASYALAADSHVEALAADGILGTDAINLRGNAFNNEIYGNNGANLLNGGGGGDYLGGWGGDDTYLVFGGEIVVENAGSGRDVVYSTVSYTLAAGSSVEVLSTNSIAGTGAINLTGNELGQEVYGNNGANILNGGAGGDYLLGFGGADCFAFTTALGSGNIDVLADFSVADDIILLENAVFTGLSNGALPASAFAAGTAASDADDRIVYNSATGQIFFDADGNGAGAQVLFATVNAGTILTASDFMVI